MSVLSPGAFDAVIFDAGGVFVLPDPTVLAPLLAPFGGSLELDDHRRAHYAAMAAKSRADDAESNWRTYNETYVKTVGVDHEMTSVAASLLDRTRSADLWRYPIAENVVAISELEKLDVPMSVVSNAAGQIEWVLEWAGVCQRGPGPLASMRTIIDSEVVGIAKPHPEIFEFALVEHSESPRDRILYVGDSVSMDVNGSRAAGLVPVLIDPFDDHVGADFARVKSVGDLIGLFVS
ncbi:MAG: HAD family hydrolase [Ilumatobacteraceae bacterium]